MCETKYCIICGEPLLRVAVGNRQTGWVCTSEKCDRLDNPPSEEK